MELLDVPGSTSKVLQYTSAAGLSTSYMPFIALNKVDLSSIPMPREFIRLYANKFLISNLLQPDKYIHGSGIGEFLK